MAQEKLAFLRVTQTTLQVHQALAFGIKYLVTEMAYNGGVFEIQHQPLRLIERQAQLMAVATALRARRQIGC